MARRIISDTAAHHLDRWLDGLMRGDLRLGDLPLPVEAFYNAGWAAAITYAREQAREYEHRLDMLYLAAFTPKDRAELLQRRLDNHFAQQDALFFAGPAIHGPAPDPSKESVCHQPVMSSGRHVPNSKPFDNKHARAA